MGGLAGKHQVWYVEYGWHVVAVSLDFISGHQLWMTLCDVEKEERETKTRC